MMHSLQIRHNRAAGRGNESSRYEQRSKMNGARYGIEPWLPKLFLVLSSMSPLFILWAIRGSSLFPQFWFVFGCVALFVASNAYLLAIVMRGRARVGRRSIEVVSATDRRQDVISYLFAMLLPFYTVDMNSWREFAASVAAFLIVVILFTSLDLHYLNLWIAVFRYHCFETTLRGSDTNGSPTRVMLISRRSAIAPGSRLSTVPISPLVVLEE